MSDVEPGPEVSKEPDPKPIRPVETVLAVVATIMLAGNIWADWSSSDYSGGAVSVALVVLIGAILGKNVGSLVGGGR